MQAQNCPFSAFLPSYTNMPSWGPGARARASRSTSRRSGPGFQASMLPGVRGLVPGHPLYFPPCFQGTGDRCPQSGVRGLPDFQEARLSGARASALLPCFQEARGKASSMLSGGKAFRLSGDHAAGFSGFFLTSRPAFMLSGFQEAMLPGFQEASRW